MKRFRWTLYRESRCMGTGTVVAESEREAMGQALLENADDADPDGNYRVVVGDLSMSTEGRDFRRSAEASGWGSDQKEDNLQGGYLYDDPIVQELDEEQLERIGKAIGAKVLTEALKKLIKATIGAGKSMEELGAAMDADEGMCPYDLQDTPCGYDQDLQREFDACSAAHHDPVYCPANNGRLHDMNADTVNPTTGEIHARCRDCGLIAPKGTGRMAAHSWDDGNSDPYGDIQKARAKMLGHTGATDGTDHIVGRALHAAKKGQVLNIILDPHGGRHVADAGADIAINEGVRIGAGGHAYPPPKPLVSNHLPYVDRIENGVPIIDPTKRIGVLGPRTPSKGTIVRTEEQTQFQFSCDACGTESAVCLNGSGPWSGVACPGCDATYSFERDAPAK